MIYLFSEWAVKQADSSAPAQDTDSRDDSMPGTKTRNSNTHIYVYVAIRTTILINLGWTDLTIELLHFPANKAGFHYRNKAI